MVSFANPYKKIQGAAVASGLPGSAEGPLDAYRHLLGGVLVGHFLGLAGTPAMEAVNYFEENQPGRTFDSRQNDIHNNNLGLSIGQGPGTLEEKLEHIADLFRVPGGNDRQLGRPAYSKTEYGSTFEVRTDSVLENLGHKSSTTEQNSNSTPAPVDGDPHGPPPPPNTDDSSEPPAIFRPLGTVTEDDISILDMPSSQLLQLLKLIASQLIEPSIDDEGNDGRPTEPPRLEEIIQKLRASPESARITLNDLIQIIIALHGDDNDRLEQALLQFMKRNGLPNVGATLLDSMTDWTVSDPPQHLRRGRGARDQR